MNSLYSLSQDAMEEAVKTILFKTWPEANSYYSYIIADTMQRNHLEYGLYIAFFRVHTYFKLHVSH